MNLPNYDIFSAKRFIAAWRVLVGVWTPKKWDLSLSALSPYTQPRLPPANPWIDRPATPANSEGTQGRSESPTDFKLQEEPLVKAHRPPSRRLIRHVLRSRVVAVNALAEFFDHLARSGRDKKVKASPHLARMFGGASEGGAEASPPEAWRYASEVIGFLEKRGAKIPTLEQGPLRDVWALSSEGEGYTTGEEQVH